MNWMTAVVPPVANRAAPSGAAKIFDLVGFDEGDLVLAGIPAHCTSATGRVRGHDEFLFVSGGSGSLEQEDGRVDLVAGMAVTIPAGVVYRYSSRDGMELLVATFPRFDPKDWEPAAFGERSQSARTTSLKAMLLPTDPSRLAPDGSEMRLLLEGDLGGIAHCRLHPGGVSASVRHPRVKECWYVLGGELDLWRSDGHRETIDSGGKGTAFTIPTGVGFQFRTTSPEPVDILIATMPPWSGDRDAEFIDGPRSPA